MTQKSKSSEPSELAIALENRAFEIQLFWQRSNYFMALMTALGIGVFAIKEPKYACLIAIFATVTSWYWYKTNLGSKFWHESWEVEVVSLAKELNIRSFERPTSDVKEQVRASLENAYLQGERTHVRRWIDKQILKKPSVSHYMILLSLTSTAMWSLISVSLAADLILARIPVRIAPNQPAHVPQKGVPKQIQKSELQKPEEKSSAPTPLSS